MGSQRPVVEVQLELVVALERYIQLFGVDLGLLDLVTIHQQRHKNGIKTRTDLVIRCPCCCVRCGRILSV